MLRILLVFRLMHAIQFAVTVPGIAGHLAHRTGGLVLLVAVVAESLWFTLHIIRNHRRVAARDEEDDWDTARPVMYDGLAAGVELCSAVAFLWACVLVMGPDRAQDMAPLLVLTTEQISGASVGSALGQPLRVLMVGTGAVAASYATVIALGVPEALAHSDVLIGLTGYGALAYLIRRGALYLLQLAADLGDMSLQLHEVQQRRLLAIELHNHIGYTLGEFQRIDASDADQFASLRKSAMVALERLRTFISTGRFSASVPLIGMIHRQVGLAANDALTVELIVTERVVGAAARVRPHQVELLEAALRALLINVPRSAGMHDALLHVDIVTERAATPDEPGERVEAVEFVVTDQGAGFPPEALAAGVAGMRSLAVHQRLLTEHGGALRVRSVPGLTQVTLTLPIAPAPVVAERPPGAREGRVRGVWGRGARSQSGRTRSGQGRNPAMAAEPGEEVSA